jgi:hypothetical protein
VSPRVDRAGGAWLSPRFDPWVLGTLTLLGLALRLPAIFEWWLNPDEGVYYSVASWSDWSEVRAEMTRNAHPPLFYLIIRGLRALGMGVVGLRVPSVVCGVLAIPALHLATRALVGRRAAALAALTIAVSPGAILQSQVIRPYAMQLALLGFLLFALARFTERRERRQLVAVGALALASVLLHYGSFPALVAAALAGLVLVLAGQLPGRSALLLAAAATPAALAAGVLAFTHVAQDLAGSSVQLRAQQSWLRPFFHAGLRDLWTATGGLLLYAFGSRGAAVAGVALAVGLVAACVQRRLLLASFALASFGLAAALSLAEVYPFGGTRHSLHLLVAVVPCVALGLDVLARARAPVPLAAAAILVLLAWGAPSLIRLVFGPRVTVASAVEQLTPRSSVVAAGPVLAQARAEPGLVVLDRQTYQILTPQLGPTRASVSLEPGALSHFRWGEADVLVSHRLSLRTDRSHPERSDHVLGLLMRARRELPALDLGERRRGWLFVGGWNAQRLQALPGSDAALGSGPPCVSGLALQPGLGWARLDPALCIERIGRAGASLP